MRVAKRMQAALAATPFDLDGSQLTSTASIGIALSVSPSPRAEDLLQDADIAVRRAKALGGARCEVFDETMHPAPKAVFVSKARSAPHSTSSSFVSSISRSCNSTPSKSLASKCCSAGNTPSTAWFLPTIFWKWPRTPAS